MPRKIGLSVYKLQIKDKHSKTWWTFQKQSNTDAYTELHNYLKSRQSKLIRLGMINPDTNAYNDDRAIKLVRLRYNDDNRTLSGIFLKGEAGIIQEIHDFDSLTGKPVYTTSRSEGALSPLYFRVYLEDQKPFGIALLQTSGVEGLKSYIQDDLATYFTAHNPQLTIRLTQLVDAAVLEAFASQGRLQDVILVNSGQTHTSRGEMQNTTVGSDALGRDGDKLQMTLHRRGGWSRNIFQKILQAVKGDGDARDVVSVPGMESYDDLLVEIKQGGQKQRFSLLNPDDSPLRYDITDKVTAGANGFPTWESLDSAARDVWSSVKDIIE